MNLRVGAGVLRRVAAWTGGAPSCPGVRLPAGEEDEVSAEIKPNIPLLPF
jgi:hypothetical protein